MAALQRRNFFFILCLFLGSIAFLLGPGLFLEKVPSFRDVYHFYYPQIVWLEGQADQGNFFPSWNRQEALGISVPGQGSSALYYPLRLLWFLPWFSASQKLAIWIAVHVVLAACGAGFAARACGCSLSMSCFAGISYGLSCPVFFQHSNMVYLAGAAWAGWAVGALIRSQHTLTKSRASGLRFAYVFALSTSMMFLAGDPQSAANAWLIAAAVVLYQGYRCTIAFWRGQHSVSVPQKLLGNLRGFGFAVVFFVTATAIQLVPTRRAAMLTNRSEAEHVYTGLTIPTQDLSRLVNDIPDEPHRAFAFSLSPWHVATAAFPLLGGHYQPGNTRWFSLLSAEGRMWVPSIYFGVIPFLAIFGIKRNERRTPLEWWLLVLAIFSVLAALGSYSPIWFVRQMLVALDWRGELKLPADGVSSLYWGLTFIPGYESFRYPAKWTTWLVLAACLLAAIRLTSLVQAKSLIAFAWSGRLYCYLVLALWLASGGGFWVTRNFPEVVQSLTVGIDQNDIWLGEFDVTLGLWQLFLTSSFLMVVLAILHLAGLVRWRSPGATTEESGKQVELGLILVSLLDLTLVGTQWIDFVEKPRFANLPADAESSFVWIDAKEANIYRDQPTNQGVAGQAEYQMKWSLGKLANLSPAANLSSSLSLAPVCIERLRNWLSWKDKLTREQPELDAVLRRLGVTHRLVRSSGDPKQFTWHAIAAPRRFCELLPNAHSNNSAAAKNVGHVNSWKWKTDGSLAVEVEPYDQAVLVVRQFNDGGWQAYSRSATARKEIPIAQAPALFLEIPMPSDVRNVTLRRKFGW